MANEDLFDDEAPAKSANADLFDDEQPLGAANNSDLFDDEVGAQSRATPEALAAEAERQKTGKRKMFKTATDEVADLEEPWIGADGESGGVLEDVTAGGMRGLMSMFPGVRRNINPAFGEQGYIAGAGNIAAGVGRNAITAITGAAATGGNPIGAGAALGADRAFQIETERKGGLKESFKEHPIATGLDIGINVASPMAPGFGQLGSTAAKAIVAPIAIDMAAGGVQGASEAIGEGGDWRDATQAGLRQAAFAGAVSGVRATPEIKAREISLFRKKADPVPVREVTDAYAVPYEAMELAAKDTQSAASAPIQPVQGTAVESKRLIPQAAKQNRASRRQSLMDEMEGTRPSFDAMVRTAKEKGLAGRDTIQKEWPFLSNDEAKKVRDSAVGKTYAPLASDLEANPDFSPVTAAAESGTNPLFNRQVSGTKPLFGKEPNNVEPPRKGEGQAPGTEVAARPTGPERSGDPSSLGAESTRPQGAAEPMRPFPQSPITDEPVTIPKEAGKHKLSFLRENPEAAGTALEQLTVGKDLIEKQRRGTISDSEMVKRAAKTGMTPEKVRNIQPGQVLKPEETLAIEGQFELANKKASELQAKLDADWDPETARQANQAWSDQFEALRVVIGQGSEYGRGLRLFGQVLGKDNLDYDPTTAQPVFNDKFKTAAAETLQKKVFGNEKVPQAIIDEFAGAKSAEEIAKILTREARLRMKTGALEAASNVIKAGMLTGIRTQMRNLGGQGTKAAMLQAENAISGLADWAMSQRTGKRTMVGPGVGTIADIGRGGKQGLKEGFDLIRGKAAPEVAKILDRLDIAIGQNTGIKALDNYVNTIFRIQGAADLPFRKFHWLNSVRQQAEVQAKNEALDGLIKKADVGRRAAQIMESPTDDMIHNATVYAEEATYAQKNKAANWLGLGVKRARESNSKTANALGFAADVGLLPFRKTPFNIAADMWGHTTAPIKAAGKAPFIAKKLWDNSLTPEEQKAFAKIAGQAGTGAAAYALGIFLAAKGLMTGSSEKESSGQRGRDEAVGRQPGAVKAFGEWRRISEAASPFSNLMVLGASAVREATKPLTDESNRAGNVGMSVFNTLADTPYFEGLQRAARAIEGEAGAERFLGGMTSAVIPTAVADAAALMDDARREARPGPGEGFLQGIGKQVQSRVPFLRNKLPARINAFGEKQPESAVNVFDPTFPKAAQEDTDPAARALVDLDISLTAPKRRLGEAQADFEKRAKERGDRIKRAIATTLGRSDWAGKDRAVRRDILQSAVNSAAQSR